MNASHPFHSANPADGLVPTSQGLTAASGRANVDAAEWQLRLRLAAAYRAVDHFGWSELTANHISLRVRNDPSEFLINPYGLLYSEITASNLVRIDGDGHVLTPTEYPINRLDSTSTPPSTTRVTMRTVCCMCIRLQAWPWLA